MLACLLSVNIHSRTLRTVAYYIAVAACPAKLEAEAHDQADLTMPTLVMNTTSREDIAELANVLAWDAVGAQIEPYLVQHAEWQRPCGVALGCRSLNSRGIKNAAASSRL